MLIEPEDLPVSVVAGAISARWGITVRDISYAPVGFGSHHWWVSCAEGKRWFATVDDVRMGDRDSAVLVGALETAAALAGHGLEFVVAPLPQTNGSIVQWLKPHYALALYPHIEGETASYGRYESHDRRLDVIGRLVALHQTTDAVRAIAPVDDLAIPQRAHLHTTLRSHEAQWDSGPLARQAQALLLEHRAPLKAALTSYDQLAERVASDKTAWVITHGEPHRGNTIVDDRGVHLIDWESARLAPRERDLWALIDEDDHCAEAYRELSGHSLDHDALDLYRRWWDLCEVSLYTHDLRSPHEDTPETQIAWNGLRDHMARAIAPYG